VKVDGALEMLRVAEAPGGFLHPLDHGTDHLQASVGNPVARMRRMPAAPVTEYSRRRTIARRSNPHDSPRSLIFWLCEIQQ